VSFMFYVSVLSIVLVVCITPTLTFAERNSGQHENENPMSPETGEAGVESRALDLIKTAEQHAMDDIPNYLWFIAGAVACMIIPVGAILGYHIGASSTCVNPTPEFDLMAIPIKRQFENKSVGVFAWVFPRGRAVNIPKKSQNMERYTVIGLFLLMSSTSESTPDTPFDLPVVPIIVPVIHVDTY